MATESRLEAAGLNEDPGREPLVSVELAAPERTAAAAAASADVAAALGRIEDALRADPHSFSFFQAVRLLERLHPDRIPVGSLDDPEREVVRFSANPALAFPASEIQALVLDDGQPAMMINFMGLIGPQGVLPHQYSLLVSERLRARDSAMADFFDMFHHRMLSLFYRAWRKHRFTLAREDGDTDALARHLSDLIGLGMESCRERLPFPDEALLYRAGLLAAQQRGAVALQELLEDFFGVTADVVQFVGGWYPLEVTDQCALGDADDAASQLGLGAVAGDEVWDQQARVRVRLGPLDRQRYDAFLPGGSAHAALAALLRFYSHDQFDFEVQLVLARDDVHGLRLGDGGPVPQQLGWSTWICTAPRSRDADETIFTLHTGAAT